MEYQDSVILLCRICGYNPADFEGVICSECKRKQDEVDIKEERKAMAEDMITENHKGQFCWIDGLTFCQEGWCENCQVYENWKVKSNV